MTARSIVMPKWEKPAAMIIVKMMEASAGEDAAWVLKVETEPNPSIPGIPI